MGGASTTGATMAPCSMSSPRHGCRRHGLSQSATHGTTRRKGILSLAKILWKIMPAKFHHQRFIMDLDPPRWDPHGLHTASSHGQGPGRDIWSYGSLFQKF